MIFRGLMPWNNQESPFVAISIKIIHGVHIDPRGRAAAGHKFLEISQPTLESIHLCNIYGYPKRSTDIPHYPSGSACLKWKEKWIGASGSRCFRTNIRIFVLYRMCPAIQDCQKRPNILHERIASIEELVSHRSLHI